MQVWQVLLYLCALNVLHIRNGNPEWDNFLIDGLGLSNFQRGGIEVLAMFVGWASMICYRRSHFQVYF